MQLTAPQRMRKLLVEMKREASFQRYVSLGDEGVPCAKVTKWATKLGALLREIESEVATK